ncbi:MAG TPA: glycoside hydrolase family 9 protein, partial [Pyrinomonadaceae bacterium]|nr:glycoside hydrolase family 9 protein [Pyrinomonadaceae bacterium]
MPYIRVNETGFRPHDVKTAIAFGREPLPSDFRLLNTTTNAVAFTGRAVPVSGGWGEFPYHAELNFSSVREDGVYVIESGSTRSPQFSISGNAHGEIADQLLEFMRQQRCGYNPFVDAVCHSFDGRTAYGPLPAGTYINASGGWHDAGDQLKYLLTSSNATA